VQSQKVSGVDNDCPLFALPQGLERSGTVFSHTSLYNTLLTFAASCSDTEAKAGFKLLCHLLATQEASDAAEDDALMVEYGVDSSSKLLNARRLAAVSIWLKEFCSDSVDSDIQKAKLGNDIHGAIFAALSGGSVEKACQVATEAGNMNLAAVLSTDLEGRKHLLQQLEQLSETGAISKVSSPIVRSLKDSAGDLRFEDGLNQKGASSLDWYRRLALRLLQEPEADLMQLISRYDEDVVSGSVPFPSPRYLSASKATSFISSLHYRLLRLYADSQALSLSNIVDPVGFTTSIYDSSHSFHLAFAISAVGPVDTSDAAVEHILDGYVAQLTSQGRWDWAVFVLLCTMESTSDEAKLWKVARAKKLVLQSFLETDPAAASRRAFLEKRLGIPAQWFEEALAYQAAHRGEVLKYIVHSLAYNPESALEALEDLYLPNILFMSQHEIDNLMQVIEAAAVAQDSLALAVYRFFLLDKRVREMVDADSIEVSQALPELLENFQSVEMTLQSYRSKAQSSSGKIGIVSDVAKKNVPLSSMVSEALEYLGGFVKLQLKALQAGVAMETGVDS
jgi:nuclear pore complex protein Nup98-Nup96